MISSLPTNNFTAYKILSLPASVGMAGYSVSLVNVSGSWAVLAFLDDNPGVNASVTLNFLDRTGVQFGVFAPNYIIPGGNVNVTETIHSGEGSTLATAKFTAVIVFQSFGGVPEIGIGVSSVGRNL